jgi:hypothetical protein
MTSPFRFRESTFSISIRSIRDGTGATAAGCARHRRPRGDPLEGPVRTVKRQRQQHASDSSTRASCSRTAHPSSHWPAAASAGTAVTARVECRAAHTARGRSRWPNAARTLLYQGRCAQQQACAAAAGSARRHRSQRTTRRRRDRQRQLAAQPSPDWGSRSSSAGCGASTPRLSPRSLTCAYSLALYATLQIVPFPLAFRGRVCLGADWCVSWTGWRTTMCTAPAPRRCGSALPLHAGGGRG